VEYEAVLPDQMEKAWTRFSRRCGRSGGKRMGVDLSRDAGRPQKLAVKDELWDVV